ncbi:hypothetical protein A7K99_03405 [Tatumella citrea]|uniref:Uncharacterized protein n=1 Tax=Tatumella citrea TaxID=53336 RepID=A0A1Y0L4M2_TATCI|nr:hypothetical protein A7K98_03405 [Tatumella citrea]ARU96966.1 hypothetical protein A7K99_03405 [Tatumella citrea]
MAITVIRDAVFVNQLLHNSENPSWQVLLWGSVLNYEFKLFKSRWFAIPRNGAPSQCAHK